MDNEAYMELFRDTQRMVAEEIPGFEVRYKNESWSSKVLAVLVWIFNRSYLTRFTTTRYPRVYFPSREFVEAAPMQAVKILCHEFVHLWDRKQKGWLWSVGYMLPAAMVPLFVLAAVLMAVWLPWWAAVAAGGAALLCALPLPAYWRMKAEMRGYTMSIAMNFWRYWSVNGSTIVWIGKEFTGSNYYWMWPFKRGVRGRLLAAVERMKAGTLTTGKLFGGGCKPYQRANDLLSRYGLLEGE